MTLNLNPRRCAIAFLGSVLLAFGLYNIHALSDVTEGGVLGLSLLLEHHYSISPALSSLVLNALFYLLGWRALGREFIGYSVFAGGGFSLCYAIFERFPPLYPQIAEFPLLASFLGALFVGTGVGLSVRAGGAPSGDDAFAMSFSKLFKTKIWLAYFISDVSVLLLSLTYIPPTKISYSLVTVLLSGQIIDFIGRIGKNHNPSSPNPDRDVLVATLRNHDQLAAAIANRFYHIPASRVRQSSIPPRYIAIYQSLRKFADNAGVLYYGEVSGYSLVRRSAIKEIPRSSRELYYRFEIKEWKVLPAVIKPDCGDFITISTTLFLLENARTISELNLSDEAELRLFRQIGKLISGEIDSITSENKTFELRAEEGRLIVFKSSAPFFSCSVSDYEQSPRKFFAHISKLFLI